ncbi:MAG: methyl-accepting chemotaxis protein [Lachnospiraceae bacterium]|nr:methyl-accepting chemotaxis protein [Lachnospiraceae bacterium]
MKSFFKSKKDKSKVNNDVLSGENSEVKGKKKSADKEKRLKEKIPKEKKPKEKKPKEKKVKADGKERKQSKILSLRNKIFVAFLVPIIFMIIVGYTAYFNAAEGMSEKFEESTQQTINMAVNYLDMSCTYVQSEGFRYAVDSSLEEYFIGMMKKDKITQSKYISDTRLTLMAAQQANPFIENIHFVTKAGIPIISTATTSLDYDGIYNEYYDDMVAISEDGRTPPKWVDDHARLTEHMGLKMDDYFISYQMPTTSKFAYIVIDIRESAVRDILLDMDLGNGSVVGFVTNTGKELVQENLKEGEESHLVAGEPVYYDKDFYIDSLNSDELSGAKDVKFQGEKYLYLYKKSEVSNTMLCALIPVDIVTGQAEAIKTITITLVIIATIIACLIGLFITFGIQKNMKSISKELNEVAEGNLTVQVKTRSRDEFLGLAKTANNMIANNKKLVTKLISTVEQLETSAGNVNTASEDINNYSGDITRAIDEISEGMNKQAEHAQECVLKASVLSDKIKDISQMVGAVEALVDQTEKMIEQGTRIVQVLSERAQETSNITARVGDSIATLKTESETINGFVQTISDISEQTNLLSLNASIEAARAGEAGRGFAVVAEEIRKLADDSSRAAGEISRNVQNISAQTATSVASAKEAEDMVALQTKAVSEVIQVFEDMSKQITGLFENLKEIANSTEAANKDRDDTLDAVENISAIIEETASGSALVREMANQLLNSVDKLSETANALDEDMQGLKTEISVFKID